MQRHSIVSEDMWRLWPWITHPLLISVSHGYAVPSIRFATKRYAGQLLRLSQNKFPADGISGH